MKVAWAAVEKLKIDQNRWHVGLKEREVTDDIQVCGLTIWVGICVMN